MPAQATGILSRFQGKLRTLFRIKKGSCTKRYQMSFLIQSVVNGCFLAVFTQTYQMSSSRISVVLVLFWCCFVMVC